MYWLYMFPDDYVNVKSAKAVDNYTFIQYFKENRDLLEKANQVLHDKQQYEAKLNAFLANNNFKGYMMYPQVEQEICENLKHLKTYDIVVQYTSPAGRSGARKQISFTQYHINSMFEDPSMLMSKSEYNQ